MVLDESSWTFEKPVKPAASTESLVSCG